MSQRTIHIVGFGSQASAWAQSLRQSGWSVQVYLRQKGTSYQKAIDLGFQPELISRLTSQLSPSESTHWIAMLCPDSVIGPIYRELIAPSTASVRLILAHGYAVYSGDLKPARDSHRVTLLAPKAIGPKLLQNFQNHFPNPHNLVAAISSPLSDRDGLLEIARGMGFDAGSLVETSFEKETMGDLISEQGLLCGSVFNFLAWTLEAMDQAGIPEALIREECLTELELIASLIREKGPGTAFKSISQAAQAGTIAIKSHLDESGVREKLKQQFQTVREKSFVNYFQSRDWKASAEDLAAQLSGWEERFKQLQSSQETSK